MKFSKISIFYLNSPTDILLEREYFKGGGGGGGANGYFFVKLDFEIAVDQQTRTSDRTFEGVPDPNRQTVPAGQPRPYLVQIRPNLAKYPEHGQNPYFMCSTCS